MKSLSFFFLNKVLIAGATISVGNFSAHAAAPGDQFKLRDFPPSPFEANVLGQVGPKPDPMVDNLVRDLDLTIRSTNQLEMSLIAEITTLTNKLFTLQEAANANDPMLQVYGRYIETAHDWVMKKHGDEYWVGNRYFSSGTPSSSEQRIRSGAIDLIDIALYKDVASNTNFAPLLKAAFETIERRLPGQLGGSYARADKLIDFHPSEPVKPVTTFEAYLAEISQRYDLVLAKLEQIQRDQNIPSEAITGWMYGDLYRLLDGSAQQYVMLSMPEEIGKLRQQLQRKTIELSRLQSRAR